MHNYDFRLQHLSPEERYREVKKIYIDQKYRLHAEYEKDRSRMGFSFMLLGVLFTDLEKLDRWLSDERKRYRATSIGMGAAQAMENAYTVSGNYGSTGIRCLWPSIVSRRVSEANKSKPLEKIEVIIPPPSIYKEKGQFYYGI